MCAWVTLLGKQGSMEPYLPPSTHISSLVGSLKTTLLFGDAERLEVGAEERARSSTC